MNLTKRLATLCFGLIAFTMATWATDFVVNYYLNDSYGDGWNGSAVKVIDEDGVTVAQLTIDSGNTYNGTLKLNGTYYEFVWLASTYSRECSCLFTDDNGVTLFSFETGFSPEDGTVLFTLGKKPLPKPTALEVTDINAKKALLSWEDNNPSDSYKLQYRAWKQVGSDVTTTGVLTQYSFDLSQYSGTGSIAIRHYNVSDQYLIYIDGIEVTDANNEVVLHQDFESGEIPSDWTNVDFDGDKHKWNIYFFTEEAFESQLGNYCAYSESYVNFYGPLTPDNWLIIPNVQLGGKFTLYARGADVSYPLENFAVLVSSDNSFNEVTTEDKSYQANNLNANSLYTWQVKCISNSDESNWRFSMFTTLPPVRGDVDQDGEVTINDVTMLVNIILNKAIDYDFNSADVDGNNSLDVGDVATLVNIILEKQ